MKILETEAPEQLAKVDASFGLGVCGFDDDFALKLKQKTKQKTEHIVPLNFCHKMRVPSCKRR